MDQIRYAVAGDTPWPPPLPLFVLKYLVLDSLWYVDSLSYQYLDKCNELKRKTEEIIDSVRHAKVTLILKGP